MAKKPRTGKVGRGAGTARFIPVDVAKRRRSTAIVETIKQTPKEKK